ncbi:Uncharacterised protein [Mycobacteroides abscessus subsp. abscessus]|nr:Uncharacterised protein [Mycobacteroides abscessus subsp. abscessus]
MQSGYSLERLGPDEQADVEQDRHDRGHRQQRLEYPDQPEEAQQADHHPTGQRVRRPTTGVLPPRVPDVDRRRERRAERRTDTCARTVGQQHAP